MKLLRFAVLFCTIQILLLSSVFPLFPQPTDVRHIYVVYDLSQSMIETNRGGVRMKADDINRLHSYLEKILFGPGDLQAVQGDAVTFFKNHPYEQAQKFTFPIKRDLDKVTFFFFGESINPPGSEILFRKNNFSINDYVTNAQFNQNHLRSVLPKPRRTGNDGHFARSSFITLGMLDVYERWTKLVPSERRSQEPAVMILVTDGKFEMAQQGIEENSPEDVTNRLVNNFQNRYKNSVLANIVTRGVNNSSVSIYVSLIYDIGEFNNILIVVSGNQTNESVTARISNQLQSKLGTDPTTGEAVYFLPNLSIEANRSDLKLIRYKFVIRNQNDVVYDSGESSPPQNTSFPVNLINKTLPANVLNSQANFPLKLRMEFSVEDSKGKSHQGLTNDADLILIKTPAEPVNRPPIANPMEPRQCFQGTAAALVLSGSDPDNDPVTFEITQKPQHGVAAINGGKLQYTPNTDYTGEDSLQYIVNDGKAKSSPNPVIFNIEKHTQTKDAKPVSGGFFGFLMFLLILLGIIGTILFFMTRRVAFVLESDDSSIGSRPFELGFGQVLCLGKNDESQPHFIWEELDAPNYRIKNRFGGCSLYEYDTDEAVEHLVQSLRNGDIISVVSTSGSTYDLTFYKVNESSSAKQHNSGEDSL